MYMYIVRRRGGLVERLSMIEVPLEACIVSAAGLNWIATQLSGRCLP